METGDTRIQSRYYRYPERDRSFHAWFSIKFIVLKYVWYTHTRCWAYHDKFLAYFHENKQSSTELPPYQLLTKHTQKSLTFCVLVTWVYKTSFYVCVLIWQPKPRLTWNVPENEMAWNLIRISHTSQCNFVLPPFQKSRNASPQSTVTRSLGSFLRMTTRRLVSTKGLRRVSSARAHGR